jgi:hypothetical protein
MLERLARARTRRHLVWAICLVFPLGCERSRSSVRAVPAPEASSMAPSSESADSASPPGALAASKSTLPPLEAEWLITLPVEGYRDARVSVPQGATERRPVVVALHGAGDRPEWACGGWRGVVDAYAFVVCPTGQPGGMPGGFVWGNDDAVEREVNAAVEALRRRFGEYVAPGCSLLAGFSQGAIRMTPILARGGGWCPQAVLCEGAYDAIGKNFAQAFYARGGRRLLLGCSQPYCAKVFRERETHLRAAGIDARTVYSGGHTHNLNGETVSTLREAWPWLVRDDDRWSSYERYPGREQNRN